MLIGEQVLHQIIIMVLVSVNLFYIWGLIMHSITFAGSKIPNNPLIMGIVALKGIEVNGRIGVEEAERRTGRKFLVDIEVQVPMKKAGVSDSIHDILNYSELAAIIQQQMKNEFHLLEAAARAIGEKVLQKFGHIEKMKIRISKVHPFMQGIIGSAMIEWDYPEDY
jgi:dihydroneopterin aldolase